jgi:hypothetical protein
VLKLKVYDGETEVVLEFEHSLRSLSKWEQKHKKSWWATQVKQHHELIEYYEFMLLNDIDPSIVVRLSPEQLDALSKYINDPATATTVPPSNEKGSTDVMTTELVYYWLSALELNWEAQDWHFNRCMALISLTGFKKQPEKKVEKGRLLQTWQQINESNKKRFGTNG